MASVCERRFPKPGTKAALAVRLMKREYGVTRQTLIKVCKTTEASVGSIVRQIENDFEYQVLRVYPNGQRRNNGVTYRIKE